MFEWEPAKISLKDVPWFLIAGILVMIFFMVGIAKADPTTAPLNNIVRIHLDSVNKGCGTGFILENGRILTAKHVIQGANKRLIIRYSDGTTEKVKVGKCRVSKKYDLAEIPVKKDKIGTKLEISNIHFIGKKVYTSGYPDNWGILWVSIGIISSEVTSLPPPWMKKIFLSDIDAISGSSGSPVFSYTDKLIGIVSSKYLCVTAVVSAEAIKEFINE